VENDAQRSKYFFEAVHSEITWREIRSIAVGLYEQGRQTDTQPSSFVTPNQCKSFNFIAFPAPAHVVKSPRRKRETGSELRQGPFTPFPSPTSTFF
jgi:hypothetical protein